jgi:hypothetical protein
MALQLVPAKETAISPVCPLNQSTIEVNLFLADKNWLRGCVWILYFGNAF